MEKLLADAKELVSRLKSHSVLATNVVSEAQYVTMRMTAMKEYQKELNQLNALTQNNSFSYSSASYIKDNAQINELEKSNTELRGLLDEHQAVLEIVMSKYREQVLRLIGVQKDSAVIKNDVFLPTTKDEMEDKIESICGIVSVMRDAANDEEMGLMQQAAFISQLQTENETLRDLLRFSLTIGPGSRSIACQTNEKDGRTLVNGDAENDDFDRKTVSGSDAELTDEETERLRFSPNAVEFDDKELFKTIRRNKSSRNKDLNKNLAKLVLPSESSVKQNGDNQQLSHSLFGHKSHQVDLSANNDGNVVYDATIVEG